MENSLLVAGFGGQGVLLIGKLLLYTAVKAGKYATFYPAYGGEQRGGTSNCTVIVADDEIGSPVLSNQDTIIVLNEPSFLKFEAQVNPGGVIIVNSSLIKAQVQRQDIRAIYLPTNEIADSIGSSKAANMVALGGYLAATKVLPLDVAEKTIEEQLGGKGSLDFNKKAFYAGVAEVEKNA